MKKIVVSALVAAAMVGGALAPAYAQAVSVEAVLGACATPGATVETCAAAQDAYIAQLTAQGLSTAEIDAAIGTMVVALAQAASSNPAVVAVALSRAAAVISDPVQAAAVAEVAAAVEVGAPVSTAVVAQAASPN